MAIIFKIKDCILDAKSQIEEITGKKVQDKIFLSGYSASGVLAQRFALIYPELINRALIGGAAGSIPIPSDKIDFPIGIKDFRDLFGKEFNFEAYKQIQFGYYVAEKEAEELAKKYNIEMPITETVNEIINNKISAKDAVNKLMNREFKDE